MSQEIINNLVFDRKLLLQKKIKAAASLIKADFLIKRSFDDIKEKLSEINLEFPMALNLGAIKNYGSNELLSRRGTKQVIETYLDPALLNNKSPTIKIIADEEYIPFAENKFDLIISVLNLHTVNDLPGCLIRLRESLKPNGVLISSIFGEKNLSQLYEILTSTELELFNGISPRIMPNISIKQLGSLLQRAGFSSPIIDSDRVEVHYKHPIAILHDLRNMGETNIMLNRNRNYLGKKFWNKFTKNYINKYGIDENEVSVNFEILTFTAIKD